MSKTPRGLVWYFRKQKNAWNSVYAYFEQGDVIVSEVAFFSLGMYVFSSFYDL